MSDYLLYDVKYRDKDNNVRVFCCLSYSEWDARSEAYKLVCDLADFSGTILTVLPSKDQDTSKHGFII
jgi:hypothetical protein